MGKTSDTYVNIGPRERKVRRILGILILIAAIAVSALFKNSEICFWWGLALFPLWYQGIRFIYDYTTGTCPLKAELGQSRLDAFVSVFGEPIKDREMEQQIRTKSRKAVYRAAAAAFLLTCLNLILMAA